MNLPRRARKTRSVDSMRSCSSAGSVTPGSRRYLLTTLLKSVSRAFYLSVRVLPSRMREPVAIAYLLARAADTIADATSLTAERRLEHLRQFRQLIADDIEIDFATALSAALADLQSTTSERNLLGMLPTVFDLLRELDQSDSQKVRSVVRTLTGGMLFDLLTFGAEESEGLISLESTSQLDTYCYQVAGCVGEFWTEISITHTPSLIRWDAEEMKSIGLRLGLALQMTNILRDVPRDLRMGRCYLPESELENAGLRPRDLLDSANADRVRPILTWGISRALEHFDAAEQYVLAIPRRNLRMRLAVLWPVLIGLQTLAKLSGSDDWLNPETRIRIPRRAVYGIIALSLLCGRSNALTRRWIRRNRRRVKESVQHH